MNLTIQAFIYCKGQLSQATMEAAVEPGHLTLETWINVYQLETIGINGEQ